MSRPHIILGSCTYYSHCYYTCDLKDALVIDILKRQTMIRKENIIISIKLPPLLFNLFLLLAVVPGIAEYRTIEEWLWGDRPDGGPLTLHGNIAQYRMRLRKQLAPIGLQVITRAGIGIELHQTDPFI